MKRDCDREFIEKLYFQEIEAKDKIHNRIQMVFGLIVIAVTVIIYLIKNTSFLDGVCVSSIVVLLSVVSFLFIFRSCWLLREAFWGNGFKYIPNAAELNAYYHNLIQYETDYKAYCKSINIEYNNENNPEDKIDELIMNELIDCSSCNTNLNELRSSQIYWAIKIFFYSLIPLALAVAIFLVMDLDAASPRHEKSVEYIIIPTNVERV
ncbi:hypothetical protein [Hafnia alvei]|uniref:hypothetical protein n=1 Tax=Hafnia alvei TaxID=569 RepID=UPI00187D41D1|nr:hypothetical protein [Hafnia alvei]